MFGLIIKTYSVLYQTLEMMQKWEFLFLFSFPTMIGILQVSYQVSRVLVRQLSPWRRLPKPKSGYNVVKFPKPLQLMVNITQFIAMI